MNGYRRVRARYYIVVFRRRNPISWVAAGLLAVSIAAVSAQSRKPAKPVPPVLPLAPFELAWTMDLPAPPSAAPSLAADAVYVPLEDGTLTAIDRENGVRLWTVPLETTWPIVRGTHSLFAVAASSVRAMDPATGATRWTAALPGPAALPPLLAVSRLLVMTVSHELLAMDTADGRIHWQRPTSDASAPAGLAASPALGFLVFTHGVVQAFAVEDGRNVWERSLPGPVGAPALGRGRVFVGSEDNALYALESESGDIAWTLSTGGDIVGAAADGETVYVSSLDHLLRAVRRSNGNQRWKQPIPTRPSGPPIALLGVVAQPGNRPALSTYAGVSGTPIGTYDAPSELQGAMLLDPHPSPRRVGAVAVTREGQVLGLRSVDLMLREPVLAPLVTLPGRPLTRELPAPARR